MEVPADDPLAKSMLYRASDLAHYMHIRDIRAAVSHGETPNGTPVTVIIVIHDEAEWANRVGKRMVDAIEAAADAAADAIERN